MPRCLFEATMVMSTHDAPTLPRVPFGSRCYGIGVSRTGCPGTRPYSRGGARPGARQVGFRGAWLCPEARPAACERVAQPSRKVRRWHRDRTDHRPGSHRCACDPVCRLAEEGRRTRFLRPLSTRGSGRGASRRVLRQAPALTHGSPGALRPSQRGSNAVCRLAGWQPTERQILDLPAGELVAREACAPFGSSARVLALKEGEIVLLPASAQIVPGRPIVAATVTVANLALTRQTLTANHVAVREVEGCARKSLWVETHGLWLEFRQR